MLAEDPDREANVVLICYTIGDSRSLEAAVKWDAELTAHGLLPTVVPRILVGTKVCESSPSLLHMTVLLRVWCSLPLRISLVQFELYVLTLLAACSWTLQIPLLWTTIEC